MKTLNNQIEPLTLILTDDTEEDRNSVKQHVNKWYQNIKIIECSSPNEFIDIPHDTKYPVFLLDIKFQDRNLLNQLLNKIEKNWTNSIKIVLSNWVKDISEKEKIRIDESIMKLDFELEPEKLLDIIKKNIQRKMDNREWEFFINPNNRIISYVCGFVTEIIHPYVETNIQENNNGEVVYRKVLFPYHLFESVGILGEYMRFEYITYIENNKIISEIRPPENDIIYDDEKAENEGLFLF
jgi:hypothetical protein